MKKPKNLVGEMELRSTLATSRRTRTNISIFTSKIDAKQHTQKKSYSIRHGTASVNLWICIFQESCFISNTKSWLKISFKCVYQRQPLLQLNPPCVIAGKICVKPQRKKASNLSRAKLKLVSCPFSLFGGFTSHSHAHGPLFVSA